jgi:hypothetical protein
MTKKGATTLSITTLSTTTFCIMTLSIRCLFVTLSINDSLSVTMLYQYAECCVLFSIMLNVIMLNVVMLNVVAP